MERRWMIIPLIIISLIIVYFGFKSGEFIEDLLDRSNSNLDVPKFNHFEVAQTDLEEEDDQNHPSRVEFMQQIQNYYRKYNPERIGDVPNIVSRYVGYEDLLIAKLEKKYLHAVRPKSEKKFLRDVPKQIESQIVSDHILNEDADQDEQEEGSRWEDFADDEEVDDEELAPISRNDHDHIIIPQEIDSNKGFNIKKQPEVFVVGLPGTGVGQIGEFLENKLGMPLLRRDIISEFLKATLDSHSGIPEFNKLHSAQALVDVRLSLFFQEIIQTYPDTKIVVAMRNQEDWFNEVKQLSQDSTLEFVFQRAFGSLEPNSVLWKKRYELFYDMVLQRIPREKRILFNVFENRGTTHQSPWYWLSVYLNRPAKHLDGDTSLVIPYTGDGTPDWLSSVHRADPYVPTALGNLKVLGIGMDSTGEDALAEALKRLELKVASESPGYASASSSSTCPTCQRVSTNLQRFFNGEGTNPEFGLGGIFEGVDAVISPSMGWFVRDIVAANPNAIVIVTTRQLRKWASVVSCKKSRTVRLQERKSASDHNVYTVAYYQTLFGSLSPHEYFDQKRYYEYLEIVHSIPTSKLLVLDIEKSRMAGVGYDRICSMVPSAKCSHQIRTLGFPEMDNGSSCH